MKQASALMVVLLCGWFAESAAACNPAEVESIAAFGCAACHDDLQSAGVRAAPDLRRSLGNVRPDFLAAFLSAPHALDPTTRMPDLLGGLAASERGTAVRELSAFLASVAVEPTTTPGPSTPDPEKSAQRGNRLFHEVGCVMCHGPRDANAKPGADDGMRSLDGVPAKYTPDGLARFLGDPLGHRPAGLMPNMHLSRGEAQDLAAYLTGTLAEGPIDEAADDAADDGALVEAGRLRFRALGCAQCHSGVDDAPRPSAGPATGNPTGNMTGGCLSATPGPGVPDYHFKDEQRSALRDVISSMDTEPTPAERVAETFAAFRCTACHERGQAGGVPTHLDAYLVTDEPDLGENARRPPSLDGVGGKLRRRWLERVLYDGASVRPYMHTRMPIFGEDNVAHLPALLEEIDAQPSLELAKAEGDDERPTREAAQKLLGVTGLGCVSCHSFNAKRGPNFQGMDLITMPERLRERWFRDFLVAPQSLLPGVIMPESWPGGVAAYDALLEGDTDRQIAALWHYLKLGRSARDPVGIAQPHWEVDVEGRPLVYRGRSRVAGFRGIAVGFPEGIHFAFDASNGAMAALWRGDFVSANWNGQGAGNFHPRANAVELPRDVALLTEVDRTAPWPLRPRTTEEEPINPDPTYPRQYGYRFRGYHQDPAGMPTLRYSIHDVMVEDRAFPRASEDRMQLGRELTFHSTSKTRLTFRALAGDIQSAKPGEYRLGRLLLLAPEDTARLRPIDGGQELMIDLDLPVGRTQLELNYDLVD